MSSSFDAFPAVASGQHVALYWDFENLHAGLFEARHGEGAYGQPDGRFKVQEPLVDVAAIADLAAALGPLAIHKAYCNWQFFGRYRDALMQAGIDLVQLFPPGGAAKNGADIRLSLDAVDDAQRHAHIGTVVVAGGDSDFLPLAQRLKAEGRRVVGLGTRAATSRHWARACHAFVFYESLVEALAREPEAGPARRNEVLLALVGAGRGA